MTTVSMGFQSAPLMSRRSGGSGAGGRGLAAKPGKPTSQPKQTKIAQRKSSTERSRECRQRQSANAQLLATAVQTLRSEVEALTLRRSLLFDKRLQSASARMDSLVQAVSEYCKIFQYGMAVPPTHTHPSAMPLVREMGQVQAQQYQRDFTLGLLHPDVEIQDWVGRSWTGAMVLVNSWASWSSWHSSFLYELKSIDISNGADSVAVVISGLLCVRVSEATIANLFPHIFHDHALVARLLGMEIRYPFRATFFFSGHNRVYKYIQDMDFVTGLLNALGNMKAVMRLLETHEGLSLDDRAMASDSATLQACGTVHDTQRDERLNVAFLLT